MPIPPTPVLLPVLNPAALALLAVMLLGGCASLSPPAPQPAMLLASSAQPYIHLRSTSEPHRSARRGEAEIVLQGSRTTAAVSRGAALFAGSWLVDPLIRPFSTLRSLVTVTMKSTGGFVQRLGLGAVGFPRLEARPVPPLAPGPGMDLARWEAELDDLLGAPTSHGTIRFLVDGDAYFPRLHQAIAGARESIAMRTYIFDNDDVAVRVANQLRESSQDVDVRILVDGIGELVGTQVDSASLPDTHRAPASMSHYLEHRSRVRVRTRSNPWFTGDHVKSTIIDEQRAFVGGMNIGREYRYDWHDLMMEVSGPVIAELQFEFDKAWAKSGALGDFAWFARIVAERRTHDPVQGHPLRVLYTTHHDSQIYRAQLHAIRQAQRYVYIQNAYFSDDKVLYELARARRRGVDVRVILASRGDSRTLDLSNEVTINTMLRNGIRVYAYPGMSHVKAAVYDGWACMGSANFDKLSLQVNEEMNLATSHPPTVQRLLDQVFTPDFVKSKELHDARPLRWTHRLAEFIADEAL